MSLISLNITSSLDTLLIFEYSIPGLVFRSTMRVLELVLGVVVLDSDNALVVWCKSSS